MKSLLSTLALALLLSSTALFAQGPVRVLAYETDPFSRQNDAEDPGLEIELLQYWAKSQGRELRVEWTADFESILPRIEAREADVAAATITVTPERQDRVDFSAGYFPVRVMLVEPEIRTTTQRSQLRDHTLATMKGTTYEKLLEGIPGSRFVYGDTEEELFTLVSSGEASALAVDSAVALTLLPKYPTLHMTLALSEEQNYAFAVPKGSPLAQELTQHIQRMKQSRIYFRLLGKYFGEDAVDTVMAAKGGGS